MSQWTEAARQELEQYFNRIRPGLRESGADADEVIEDLRNHLQTEIEAAKLSIVTESDIQRLLNRIGAPQPTVTEAPSQSNAYPAKVAYWEPAGIFTFLLAVLLPLATITIELATGMCAAAFFDPMPSWFHMVLVGSVPVINGLSWIALRANRQDLRGILGWANGAAVGITIAYAVLFLPLMLPGMIGVIFFGFGLLPLTPALTLIGTILLRRKLRGLGGSDVAGLPGFWRGIGLSWLALLLVATPEIVTRLAMQKAISSEPEEQARGIRWLRSFGREEARNSDLWSWTLAGPDRPTPERARELYFRVTGRPFNSVPPPKVRTGRGAWEGLDDWTWDDDHGADHVGGRIKGLFLASSRLDTTINPDAAWSYTEWTLEFRNDSQQQREARAQILLPPGGVVSRLTLWVNGEEREAAFAGRAQTSAAYHEVAVRQRRDPVLVTTAGPDRVQMQCFPVPPRGGVMKVRIGITAPVTLQSETNGLVCLPSVLERNFSIPKDFRHAVWAQSPHPLQSDCKSLGLEPSNHGQLALRGEMTDADLGTPRGLIQLQRQPERFAWTANSRTATSGFIRQEIAAVRNTPATNVVFVLDGSVGMAAEWQEIAQAVTNVSATTRFIVAGDEVRTFTNRNALLKFRPAGGQDNLPALVEAWNAAVRSPHSVIVWVHGPQPVKIATGAALQQAIERTPVRPKIYELQTEPGPDRVLEQLDGMRTLVSVPRTGSIDTDLRRLMEVLSGKTPVWQRTWSVVTNESQAKEDQAVEGSLQLARLWANDSVARLKSKNKLQEATKQAAAFQLVTPVSGAVVLENQVQYAQNNLQPADVETVPSIPEPGPGALVIVGLMALRWSRERKHQRLNQGSRSDAAYARPRRW